MNWFSALVVFVVLWWLVFFAVLPWGIRRSETTEKGHDPGAPSNPMLWRRIAVTTVVAGILFVGVYWLIASNVVTLEDLDWTRWLA